MSERHECGFDRDEYIETIQLLNERIDLMASQADVDQLTTELNQVATDLAASSSTLQTEIDNLAAANPSIDLTALQAAAAPLDAAVQKIGTLAPDSTPPASSTTSTSTTSTGAGSDQTSQTAPSQGPQPPAPATGVQGG